MKKVTYNFEDMASVLNLLNEVSCRGLTLEQSRYLSAAATIIDEKILAIENDEKKGEENDGTE